ncbi:neugrin [Sphaeramia orbicularis]|uniref:Neugrin n=1 Tax=Sphaeramia orbicularis TaxID=375764 RepID=A0A673CV01_9TELE|nr:neugrin [Sphaeramia orbicularis]
MARPLQLLSLLSRVGALSPMPSTTFTGRRFVSKGVTRTWNGLTQRDRASTYGDEEVYEGGDELEDVEDKLQALLNEGRKRQKTVKYHILRRKMTPSGAPERSLTWDAIEQIRYLKAEQPEEWTVKRLAEGFSVSPDVILRVLRTKFIPSPERKAKQDTKVMVALNQQTLPSGVVKVQERPRLTGNSAAAVLPPGNTENTVVPVENQTLTLRGEGSGSLTVSPVPVAALGRLSAADTSKHTLVRSTKEENATSRVTEEEEESWDGQVLTEEQLEQCMETVTFSPVVQVGKDFFDVEGKFLYRI